MDDEQFKLEVVQRLTRIETKVDAQGTTVSKNCDDIDKLKDDSIASKAKAEQSVKIAKIAISAIGIIGTILTVISVTGVHI